MQAIILAGGFGKSEKAILVLLQGFCQGHESLT